MSKKPWPVLTSDEEAEAFVATADLTDYDVAAMLAFEYTAKDSRVTMRLPGPLLDAVKARAKARGIPYQRFMREVLELEVRG